MQNKLSNKTNRRRNNMPIVSEVKGDLVALAKAGQYKAIVQGCNCHCVMGAGLAPQIKKAWPEAYEADQKTVRGDKDKLGKFTYHYDGSSDVFVFNLYTQYGFERKPGVPDVNYQAVAEGFKRINAMVNSVGRNLDYQDIRKVGIPLIGAGLAGGHWEAIKAIIDLVTPDIEIELVIYDPKV